MNIENIENGIVKLGSLLGCRVLVCLIVLSLCVVPEPLLALGKLGFLASPPKKFFPLPIDLWPDDPGGGCLGCGPNWDDPEGPPLPAPSTKSPIKSIKFEKFIGTLQDTYEKCIEETNDAFKGEGEHGGINECWHCLLEPLMTPDQCSASEDGRCGTGQRFARQDLYYYLQFDFKYTYRIQMAGAKNSHIYKRDFLVYAPIFIRCENWQRDNGLGILTSPNNTGYISVKQGIPTAYIEGPSGWEEFWNAVSLGYLSRKIENLIKKQLRNVSTMDHKLNLDIPGFTGEPCSSLGWGNRGGILADLEIIWNAPPINNLFSPPQDSDSQ